MFVSTARSLPLVIYSVRLRPYLQTLDQLPTDKRSSLLKTLENYIRQKIEILDLVACTIKILRS
jgi:hypothetical protein